MTDLHYYDAATHETYPFDTRRWRGDSGAPLELAGLPPFDPALIRRDVWSLWRYRAFLPVPADAEPVGLGEGMTPLVPLIVDGRTLHFKLEFMAPTGSYKDRGVTTLMTGLISSVGWAGAPVCPGVGVASLMVCLLLLGLTANTHPLRIQGRGGSARPVGGTLARRQRVRWVGRHFAERGVDDVARFGAPGPRGAGRR